MVRATAIKIDPMSRVALGSSGEVREGLLDGWSEKMAVKELRPKGDEEGRLRVQVVG